MRFACAKWLLLLLIPFSISPRGIPKQRYLPNDAYVWQRRWTPAIADALAKSSDLIRAWRVLVAEADAHGNWSLGSVDWAALRRSNRPAIFVVRIDGQLARPNESSMVDEAASGSTGAVNSLRRVAERLLRDGNQVKASIGDPTVQQMEPGLLPIAGNCQS